MEEFKPKAIQFAEASGRMVRQVVDDLGIGLSGLMRLKRQCRDVDPLTGPGETRAAVTDNSVMRCLLAAPDNHVTQAGLSAVGESG